jgi:hypothetical protein
MLNSIAYFEVFPSAEWFLKFACKKDKIQISNQLCSQIKPNRFLLPGPNKLDFFTIPISKNSYKHFVSEIYISQQSKWDRELKNALQTLYGKTPYFEYYAKEILGLFKCEKLSELGLGFIAWALKRLQWDAELYLIDEMPTEFMLPTITPYVQSFEDKFGFVHHTPIFDLLFSLGPEAGVFLERQKK